MLLRMMKICRGVKSNGVFLALIGVIALMLICCGDGAEIGDNGNGLAGGGIGGTGVCVGSVSSFGSIYSNGIHFDTARAEIIVEGSLKGKGDEAAHTHLNVGQMVRIEGDINDDGTGVAARIYYDKTIEGPVTSVEVLDPYTSRIVVLGQHVFVDSQTAFVNTDLTSLKTNHRQVVEISGFFSSDGVLKAAFIAKKKGGNVVTVTGSVADLDTSSQLFRMGELSIDYSKVATPMPIFEDRDKVRVSGIVLHGGILEADTLMEWAPLDFRIDAERIKIQGVAQQTDTDAVQDIMVDDVPVHLDEDTNFQGIDSADELEDGIEIIVNGSLEGGVVIAETVEIKSDSTRAEGVVSLLNTEEATFILDDRLIRINPATTIYKYSTSPCQSQIQIVDGVEEGDEVVVYGWIRTDDSITAKWIKINPQSSSCVQQCYWVYSHYYGGYVLYCPQ